MPPFQPDATSCSLSACICGRLRTEDEAIKVVSKEHWNAILDMSRGQSHYIHSRGLRVLPAGQIISLISKEIQMTYLPMPTVDQLLQVFKDRGWKPTPVRGCWRSYVADGCCCALPALVALGDPEWFEKWLSNAPDLPRRYLLSKIYERADELYGPDARYIYSGFDDNGCNTNTDWYQLGLSLRNALGVTKEDHDFRGGNHVIE